MATRTSSTSRASARRSWRLDVADGGLELVGGALGDDAAAVDDRDAVGELVGLVEVLRGEQHGRARRDEPADGVPHLRAGARVEAGGRLVEEDAAAAGR